MWWSGCDLWFWLVASLTQRLQLLIHLQRRRSIWRLLKATGVGESKTIEKLFLAESRKFFRQFDVILFPEFDASEMVPAFKGASKSIFFFFTWPWEGQRNESAFDLSLSFSNVDEWSISFSWIFLFRSQETCHSRTCRPEHAAPLSPSIGQKVEEGV